MQCALLNGGETVSLTNLLPAGSAGSRSGPEGTIATFQLPVERVTLRLDLETCQTVFVEMQVDTLIVDLEAMLVSLVWRVRVPMGMAVRDAALFKLAAPAAS